MAKIKNTKDFGTTFGIVVASLFIILLVSIILAVPVWLLWNWLMPAIFGLAKLSLVQAWGLSLLSGFLFKSTSVSNK